MSRTFPAILIACSVAVSLNLNAAGFRTVEVENANKGPLQLGIWHPSEEQPPELPNTQYLLPVALDAPMSDTNGSLIVISHGYSGWYGGHADTAIALADAGFIVAAPSHAGNTWSDMSSTVAEWVIDRPQQISAVIDYMTSHKTYGSKIDKDSIGVYGFSAGGYTALGLIGGVPDLDHAQQHCVDDPTEFACEDGLIDAIRSAGLQDLPAEAWGADPRVAAASISAPGLGFAYTKASLQNVTAKVQLWSGEQDQSVPTNTNAALIADRLPQSPETHWVEKASHFAFMVVACREAFKKDDPEEYEMVCGDQEGFDRRQFHDSMHVEMIRFFNESFGLNQ